MITRDFELIQGATNVLNFVKYSDADTILDIASIAMGFPTVFTVTAHGLPTGPIPIAILDVDGLSTGGFTKADRTLIAIKVDVDTFNVMVDSSNLAAYTSGGKLIFSETVNLTGYTARAMFRRSVGAIDPPLLSLTDGSGIVLGTSEGTVDITISDTDSDAWTAPTSVYDVELVDGAGVVERFARGTATLSKQVTR